MDFMSAQYFLFCSYAVVLCNEVLRWFSGSLASSLQLMFAEHVWLLRQPTGQLRHCLNFDVLFCLVALSASPVRAAACSLCTCFSVPSETMLITLGLARSSLLEHACVDQEQACVLSGVLIRPMLLQSVLCTLLSRRSILERARFTADQPLRRPGLRRNSAQRSRLDPGSQ